MPLMKECDDMSKVTVELNKDEHVMLLSALGLAVASAKRLSNRGGVSPTIATMYVEEARKADALRSIVASWQVK